MDQPSGETLAMSLFAGSSRSDRHDGYLAVLKEKRIRGLSDGSGLLAFQGGRPVDDVAMVVLVVS